MLAIIAYNKAPMDSLIIFCAKYLLVFVVLGLVVAWLRVGRSYKLQFIAAVIVAGIAALVLSRIAGKLYYDPRPFVSHHTKPLIAHAADNGFPSDHALLTMTLTAVTYFYSKKVAAGMLVLTTIVGAARVLADVHSPIDIGGAWLIGIIGAVAGYYVSRWAFAKYAHNEQKPVNPES